MFRMFSVGACVALTVLASSADAAVVTINGNDFELNQLDGATVTYRADGSVSFDGKLWDNEVGVDGYSLAELASGQFGGDPGDQVSLNDRSTPDWLQLNYAGSGVEITSDFSEFYIYEISSNPSVVDVEGTSFRVQFNGGAWHNAGAGDVSFFPLVPTAENTNQIMFDLLDFGFTEGDFLQTVRIENLDSGSDTSDPDFIFAAIASTGVAAVPEPSSLALIGIGGAGMLLAGYRRKRKAQSV